jgi:hypothetical protein
VAHGYGEVSEHAEVSVDLRLDDFQQFLSLIKEELVHD